MSEKIININGINIGNKNQLVLIAGPCVIESEKIVLDIAEKINSVTSKMKINFIFKSSFDKANRTSINSYRGPGILKGLKILEKVKTEFNLPVITDIHAPEQAKIAASIVDLLQIPAFLCRQTDLIVEAAKTGLPVNIKKAQFMSAHDMLNVIKKMEKFNNYSSLLCERGTCFGYNNLVVDMRSIIEMKKFGYPVVFDATHSVQRPGGGGSFSSGSREYVFDLSKAAVAIGIDALFLEVHNDPDNAKSDGPNMIKLNDLEEILKYLIEIDLIIKKGIK